MTEERDQIANAAMAARLMAGWTNPGPTNSAYRTWKDQQPPEANAEYCVYIAQEAYRMADAMLEARKVACVAPPSP